MKIFVCYHKKYPLCKSDVLTPIHVGKVKAKTDLGIIGDNTGDNISIKNPYFCELTVTYWIWKNVREDVVGLCHYRRYFNLKNEHTKTNKITADFAKRLGNDTNTLSSILSKYDIVLPKKEKRNKYDSLYAYYTKKHEKKDLEDILNIIKEKYPNQYKTAKEILHNSIEGYYYNMIIAKKDVFDNYAKWLFDILFELEKQIQKDIEKRELYQQRVYGFLAERMMTIWVALHPELKIKEVPVVFIEENKRKWYKYLFVCLTKKIFSIFRRKHG
ncbi:MAG: DUF4422 domain-containing protein [Elusimicrobiaceae bacterium]|nr:DUF4422 domain-containing protein [Elusimicrobiaceae bacterium]